MYLAPETILSGENSYASNIWSFGIICYEIFTGMNPFGDSSSQHTKVIFQIVNKEAPSLKPHYSENMKNLILMTLQKNPQERFQVEEILEYSSWLKSTESSSEIGKSSLIEYKIDSFLSSNIKSRKNKQKTKNQ
jgi:serine/threonine protein kinase